MEKTPYHDNSTYIDDEFDDDFDYTPSLKETNFKIEEGMDIGLKPGEEHLVPILKKLNHKTDTHNYNSFEFDIITPEEADKQAKQVFEHNVPNASPDYADPIIAQAVYQIESKLGRKINYDEFDKLCKTYAAELTNRDAQYKGTDEPNPIDYKLYYDTLIQNKKVKPAYEMRMSKYEDSLVTEIDQLMKEHHSSFDSRDLHIARGDPINIRHKGKVYIRDEEHNQEIKIDNKKDVDLLRMKYRKEWLDKKHKHDIDLEINGAHSNDGFE